MEQPPRQQQQPQPPQQQQMTSQIQSQPIQLQQQLGLQQQPNLLQRDVQQQRLQALGQASGSLLQQQNVMDQQTQLLYQSQRALPETSLTQTGQANGGDWQEEVYQKIKTMKEMYLPELNEMNQKIADKLQQHDSLPQQPKSDQIEKLTVFKTILERLITFLQVSKNNISPSLKEKLVSYEKQIVNFVHTNRPRKPVSSLQQQGQLPPSHMHSMQQHQFFSAQTGQANGGDWQEEVYQKIKTMKEMYLPDLNEMNQKIADKLQQYDSLPHPPNSDQFEKLKVFKTILERIITFLQVSKNNISPSFKEKLVSYERQIVNFVHTNRPRNPVSSLQEQIQLPQSHMHPMMQQQQSQNSRGQPYDNHQMNLQMQSMNLSGSMATVQPNITTNVQHNSAPSVSGVSTIQQNMLSSSRPGCGEGGSGGGWILDGRR